MKKKIHTSKIFRTVLSRIHELESPQIDCFNRSEIYCRPLYFTFRFKKKESTNINEIYSKLIDIVNRFEGNLKWVMHNYCSSKNYTIEPEVFFEVRKSILSKLENKGEYNHDVFISSFGRSRFIKVMNLAINDITKLTKEIEELYTPPAPRGL